MSPASEIEPYRSAQAATATPLALAREDQRGDTSVFTLAWTRGFPVGFAILFVLCASMTFMVFAFPHSSYLLRFLMIAMLVWLIWQIYDHTFARPELSIDAGGVVTVRRTTPPRKIQMRFRDVRSFLLFGTTDLRLGHYRRDIVSATFLFAFRQLRDAARNERLPALAVELTDGKHYVIGPMFRAQRRDDVDALIARMNDVLEKDRMRAGSKH